MPRIPMDFFLKSLCLRRQSAVALAEDLSPGILGGGGETKIFGGNFFLGGISDGECVVWTRD